MRRLNPVTIAVMEEVIAWLREKPEGMTVQQAADLLQGELDAKR